MNKLLILSGPTHEYLDPVRFIGNASSGKMGKALAEEALKRGLDVDFISGPVAEANLPTVNSMRPSHQNDGKNAVRTPHLQLFKIISAEEMLATAQEKFASADIIIFAAAVADFQPVEKFKKKQSKSASGLKINLKPTPDIAATLCAHKKANQITAGFALQTHAGKTEAHKKRIAKNFDAIVLNTPATLGAESGFFTWIDGQGSENWGQLSKSACAEQMISRLTAMVEPARN